MKSNLRIFQKISKSGLAASFPLGARLFHSIEAQVPRKLISELEQKFQGIDPDLIHKKYDAKKIAQGAEMLAKWLEEEKADPEVADFSQALKDLEQPEIKGLILHGTSTIIPVARYFTDIVMRKVDSSLTIRVADAISGKEEDLPAHSDGSARGGSNKNRAVFGTLVGIKSQGKVRTYAIDLEELAQELPEKSRQILALPIFGYLPEKLDFMPENLRSLNSKILYRNSNNVLNVSFAYGLKERLAYNVGTVDFSEDEIAGAVSDMHDAVNKLHKENRVKSVYVKENMQFIYKNLELLHGRDHSGTDPDRQVIFLGYMPDSENVTRATGTALKDQSRDLGVT